MLVTCRNVHVSLDHFLFKNRRIIIVFCKLVSTCHWFPSLCLVLTGLVFISGANAAFMRSKDARTTTPQNVGMATGLTEVRFLFDAWNLYGYLLQRHCSLLPGHGKVRCLMLVEPEMRCANDGCSVLFEHYNTNLVRQNSVFRRHTGIMQSFVTRCSLCFTEYNENSQTVLKENVMTRNGEVPFQTSS